MVIKSTKKKKRKVWMSGDIDGREYLESIREGQDYPPLSAKAKADYKKRLAAKKAKSSKKGRK